MNLEPHHAACRRRTPEEHASLWEADTEALEMHDRIAISWEDLEDPLVCPRKTERDPGRGNG